MDISQGIQTKYSDMDGIRLNFKESGLQRHPVARLEARSTAQHGLTSSKILLAASSSALKFRRIVHQGT